MQNNFYLPAVCARACVQKQEHQWGTPPGEQEESDVSCQLAELCVRERGGGGGWLNGCVYGK